MWHEWPMPERPGQPPLVVMAPKEGKPADLRICIRGNHHNRGALVSRHFVQVLTGENSPPLRTAQSGRLELARWIADHRNPLTARVLVNRVWQHHFGRGLVATSDNFGLRGERPTHPELLDWLAARFIESGWSIKALHRLILLSGTYQMAGNGDVGARQADPGNRLLWHVPRRRLDAEVLRDSMLAVAGRLDLALGGGESGEFLYKQGEVIDKKRDFFRPNRVQADDPLYTASVRRSIYLPVVRNALPDVLMLFDAADPNGVTAMRNDTTVPPQALFLLNHPFVRTQALHLAGRVLRTDGMDAERIRAAYRVALGRDPHSGELADSERVLKDYAALAVARGQKQDAVRALAWQSFCQTLLCGNEFLYVE
jgi:hypothetical protein